VYLLLQGVRIKGWLRFRIMCQSGATYLPVDFELAILKSNSTLKHTSSSFHPNVTSSHRDIAEKLLT